MNNSSKVIWDVILLYYRPQKRVTNVTSADISERQL